MKDLNLSSKEQFVYQCLRVKKLRILNTVMRSFSYNIQLPGARW